MHSSSMAKVFNGVEVAFRPKSRRQGTSTWQGADKHPDPNERPGR